MTSTTGKMQRSWYLVFTKPRQESLAQENLERQSYETYLPLIRERRRRNGKLVHVTEPLFSRYLFIHLNKVTDNWSPIRSTMGVSGIVRFGLHPTMVPEALIQSIKVNDDEEGVRIVATKEFNSGDSVRIVEGPMFGFEGTFVGKNSKERVTILLDIVGHSTKVNLCETQLEQIS